MEINVRKRGGVSVLELSGKMTIGRGDVLLRDRFKELLDAGERFFLLEMARLSYLDSAGVGELVACAKRAYQHGGVIKIVLRADGKVRQIFSVTCLDRVFEVFDDERLALAGFARGR